MNQVHVDFNDLVHNGKVVALDKWAQEPLKVGEYVYASDFDETDIICKVVDHKQGTDEFYLEMIVDVTDESFDDLYTQAEIAVWTVREREGFVHIFGTQQDIEDYRNRLKVVEEKYYALRAIKYSDEIKEILRGLDD